MTIESPGAVLRGTYLSVEQNENPIYGSWSNQQIMGIYPCRITATEAADGDIRFVDALGCAGVFRRGGLAIHVSGRDLYGNDDYIPGRIRAMAIDEVAWPPHARNKPSGLGCHAPEPAVIVYPGADVIKWAHHAHYSDARYFWTLEGIWKATLNSKNFTPRDLCDLHDLSYPNSYTKYGSIQARSARRILEAVVGASNHGIEGQPVLLRGPGRWAYHWFTGGTQ